MQGNQLGGVSLWRCSIVIIRLPLAKRFCALLWCLVGTAALGRRGRNRNCRGSRRWFRKDFIKVNGQVAQQCVFLMQVSKFTLTVRMTYVGAVDVWRKFPDW